MSVCRLVYGVLNGAKQMELCNWSHEKKKKNDITIILMIPHTLKAHIIITIQYLKINK